MPESGGVAMINVTEYVGGCFVMALSAFEANMIIILVAKTLVEIFHSRINQYGMDAMRWKNEGWIDRWPD